MVLGQQNRREISRMLYSQWLAAFIFVVLFWILFSKVVAISFLSGSLVSILPTWMFAKVLFRYQGASKARLIVQRMYVGEAMKMLFTALLFLVVIFLIHPIWWACFTGFLLAQISLCIAPLFWVCQDRN